jgi:TRAP-type uncharacterized transport system fused permease subunit
MRCPACKAENDEGAAFCAECAAPLTAYAGSAVADADPARTARRLAEVSRRPAVAPVMAAVNILGAVWFAISALRALAARPSLSEDATNYLVHAFGGLQAIVLAAFMVPMALAMLLLAWGSLTQRAWAWYGNAALLALAALVTLSRYSIHRLLWVLAFVGVVALAYGWLQTPVRRWYGTEDVGV